MKDTLQRFIFNDLPIRGQLIHLDNALQQALHYHEYAEPLKKTLMQAMTMAPLLAGSLKIPTKVNIQIQNRDQSKLLLAQCNHQLQLRGMARFDDEQVPAAPLDLFDPGFMMIILDPEQGGERYEAVVELVNHNLIDSLHAYFKKSEQIKTWIKLSYGEQGCSALLLQALPDEENEVVWEHVITLAQTLKDQELLTLDNETILTRLFHDDEIKLFEQELVQFKCQCSIERMKKMLLSIGCDEVIATAGDKKIFDITCDFCGKVFTMDRVDIEELFKTGGISSSETDPH